ncbi:molybdopterin-dependent oxidoreductase [Hydrogenophaga atypica]|uniref:Molybdopterin-dependent oxidoreductase n=1 Tax=Hydrogenophaga atypica TaxID=249409 RepID=A0ABW2QES2_9BURK
MEISGLNQRRVVTGALVISVLATSVGHAADQAERQMALCPPSNSLLVLRLSALGPNRQATCDIAALQALPQRELVTSLPTGLGPPGAHRWQGVSLRLLAQRMGATPGHDLRLAALNDYAVTVPWSDLERYDPIVAHQRNGVPLSVREKGPLMLVYPFDAHPTLDTQQYLNRSIWHIQAITFK